MTKLFGPENPDFPFYTTLGNSEFRLLKLYPARPNCRIQVELVTNVFLPIVKHTHNYDALSYCAGDPKDNEIVSVNGYEFNAFRSLATALAQLRHPDKARLLWIDQICINQHDLPERDNQVLKMRDIYQNASQVHIWLGPARMPDWKNPYQIHNGEDGLDFLNEFFRANREALYRRIDSQNIEEFARGLDGPFKDERYFHEARYEEGFCRMERKSSSRATNHAALQRVWVNKIYSNYTHPKTLMDERELINALKWLHNTTTRREYDKKWSGLWSCYHRHWWQRSWVVQEAALANDLTIHCGASEISWDDFMLATDLVARLETRPLLFEMGLSKQSRTAFWQEFGSSIVTDVLQPAMIDLTRSSQHKILDKRPEKLLALLRLTRRNQASDARDKVYSVLGLLQPSELEKYGIEPNYQKSVADVFVEVAKADILLHPRLEILGLINDGEKSDSEGHNLPSWTPDWTLPPRGAARFLSESGLGFAAGGFELQTPYFTKSYRGEKDRVLVLKGFQLSKILLLGTTDNAVSGDLGSILSTLESWERLIKDIHAGLRFPTSAFFKTLEVGQRPSVEYPATSSPRPWWALLEKNIARMGSQRMSYGRRFFILKNGRMGLAPREAREGDHIFIPEGGRVPLLRRPLDDMYSQLIGECYVHGLMQGEILDMYNNYEVNKSSVFLV